MLTEVLGRSVRSGVVVCQAVLRGDCGSMEITMGSHDVVDTNQVSPLLYSIERSKASPQQPPCIGGDFPDTLRCVERHRPRVRALTPDAHRAPLACAAPGTPKHKAQGQRHALPLPLMVAVEHAGTLHLTQRQGRVCRIVWSALAGHDWLIARHAWGSPHLPPRVPSAHLAASRRTTLPLGSQQLPRASSSRRRR